MNKKKKNPLLSDLRLVEMSDFDNMEMIPLSPGDFDDNDDPAAYTDELPILPIRNIVLFPGMVIPVTVGRQKSIRLVKKQYKSKNKVVGVVAMANPQKEEPTAEDLYRVGTLAHILKMIVLPDGNVTIIVQGKKRFQIHEFLKEDPHFQARVSYVDDNFPVKPNREAKALIQSLRDAAHKTLNLNPEIPREAQIALDNIESNNFLIHFLSANTNADQPEKQALLETFQSEEQATKLLELMMKDIQLLEMKREIQSKASSEIDQQQRDYYIRQQIKVLQEELGIDSPEQEIDALQARAAQKKWNKDVNEQFQKEISKLRRTNPMSPEYPIGMNYLELMVDLPWNEYTKDFFDLKKAQKILDQDHFGLEKIKERIIEYLAVLKMKGNLKAPILCLYGPPGVGKTSLGKSIAKALGRKYVRMALGGVHDESEIRGHRKTYIGAMPGKIIQNIRKAKSSNPVFILDEIDKVSSDFRGDPSSALLEVLDPEQNSSFQDNYLEVEFDLSKVLFIATANSLEPIQPALRDRMEIIELTGYTMEEKVQIAKKYLIPKQKQEHGLDAKMLTFSDAAIQKVIEGYTRESGVRSLEQKIGTLVRKITKAIALEEEYPKNLRPDDVVKLLGAEYFDKDEYDNNDSAGVVTGLAWTSVGGEILFVESSMNRGRGTLTLSGQLGEVMKESAITALSYLKAHADELGIDHRLFEYYNLHVHVPAGAVPKDGPSAGITMVTSMASAFTQRKVKSKLAMTGEVTLRGKVLPVGGIKEKILAAKRAGIREVILCYKNRKDVEEITPAYISDLTFHYVSRVEEVLELALLPEQVANPIKFVFPDDKGKPADTATPEVVVLN
ncbi:endopeptidase La [Siphonobacter aquaeclarae]|jgi:ATP-dependent Lon protease|uniref:Lon protease n=1 Tax=Siphonobacter aquaeclarae TaxID=563176 RepID=A0A1G9KZW2_9BACT|nr:endopeptidase La [Siphonobacter aquaeclarae]SDL54865.1 ATP-dependent Lon protease [Siphonobacter aquaeclarae]